MKQKLIIMPKKMFLEWLKSEILVLSTKELNY